MATGLDFDVCVIGAGPAGAAAALETARRGLRVALIDKATFPRDKCCGDGLTTAALRILEYLGIGVELLDHSVEVEEAYVRAPSGHVARFPFPSGAGVFAAVVERSALDHSLVRAAGAAGAELMLGSAVNNVSASADSVTVATATRTLRAGWVVAADGAWSPTAKSLGIWDDGYLGDFHAFRQYVADVDMAAATELWVSFERDLLPGYFWSFPLPGNRANIGFGITRKGSSPTKHMAALWRDLLDRPHIRALLGDFTPLGPHKAWPIPAEIRGATLSSHRALVVGDAARVADPMTGEGIAQAMESGILAADAIAHGGSLEHIREHFEHAMRDSFVADQRMARALRAALSKRWGAEGAVRLAGATPWTRRNFARWLFEDYHRAQLFTPRRWDDGVIPHSGGAYLDD